MQKDSYSNLTENRTMYDYGHCCLLIFAQGTWKPQYRKKLIETTQDSFISVLEPRSKEEESRLDFDETEKIPLFDPKELGKSQKECPLCSAIYKILQEKKSDNDGVCLFSHTVPDVPGFKTFTTPLFDDPRIKKLYYFELGPETFVIGNEKYIPQLQKRNDLRLSKVEFFNSLDKNEFQTNMLYEIHK